MKTPADVIYDMLTGALDGSTIDAGALSDAMARVDETGASASAVVGDILEQLDAVLYANPLDGRIKLVRVGGGS